VPLAVNVAEAATPFELVTAVFTPPANVPLAPLPGTINITVTPLTGLLPASFTIACKGNAKAVLITAVCGVPLIAVSIAAAPAVFVRLKLADPTAPAVAVTV